MAEQDAVVVVTHTVGDGTVVRWYRTLAAAECHQVLVSASRNGVMIHGSVYLHDIPQHWLAAAEVARVRLTRGQDVTHFATHRHDRFLNGPLVPVDRP